MILTVTINPLLERRLFIEELKPGSEHRSKDEIYTAGGKGINVSRELNELGVNNLAFTLLGGNNGKLLKNILSTGKINFSIVQTKSETRMASLIIEENKNRLTTFFGLNSEVTVSEAEEFKIKLKKMIENCEIVIFSGSSPDRLADEIFPFGINAANEFDKISICDTYGPHLRTCIESGPTIIHNNLSETSRSLDISLKDEKEIIDYLNYLYGKGIKQVYLTDGGRPVYASNFDFIYKAEFPVVSEVDATGSGDAFTAGIAYGLHNALTFEETFTTAVSLGAINASSWEICKVSREDVENFKMEVKVSTIGKKIVSLEE